MSISEQTASTLDGTVTAATNPAETGSSQQVPGVDWAALVAQVQAGEEAGMEQLYRIFSRGLRYLLVRQLGPQDHEDILHETFLITLKALRNGDLRQPECLPGFIRTVAQRQVAANIGQQVHSRNREAELDAGITVSDRRRDPEQESILRQKTEVMKKALVTLRPRDREVLVRFYLQEQRPEQICREMNLTATQFRLVKSRAKATFGKRGKAELKKMGGALGSLHRGAHREAA